MAFSWQSFTATAGQTNINVNIVYFERDNIYISVDDVQVTNFHWASDTLIVMDTPFVGGETVVVYRRTNKDKLRVEFSEGAAFTRDNLDEENTQLLYLAQEMIEGVSAGGVYTNMDLHNYRIINLGNPINIKDAANKEYVDTGDARLQSEINEQQIAISDLAQTIAQVTNRVVSDTITISSPSISVVIEIPNIVGLDVYLNGVRQLLTYSYSFTSNTTNTTITFAETLPVGTIVEIVGYTLITPPTSVASLILIHNNQL